MHYGRTMDDEMDDRDPFADPERLRTWILGGDAGWPNPPPCEDDLDLCDVSGIDGEWLWCGLDTAVLGEARTGEARRGWAWRGRVGLGAARQGRARRG